MVHAAVAPASSFDSDDQEVPINPGTTGVAGRQDRRRRPSPLGLLGTSVAAWHAKPRFMSEMSPWLGGRQRTAHQSVMMALWKPPSGECGFEAPAPPWRNGTIDGNPAGRVPRRALHNLGGSRPLAALTPKRFALAKGATSHFGYSGADRHLYAGTSCCLPSPTIVQSVTLVRAASFHQHDRRWPPGARTWRMDEGDSPPA